MRTDRLFITVIHCIFLMLMALICNVPSASAQSAGTMALPDQIRELEGLISRYEENARRRQPDAKAEMQQLLSMAKLAALYAQSGRIQESWPLAEKILVRLEKIYGPDHPNIAGQLEANAASYALQGRYADAEKLHRRALAINERAFGAGSVEFARSLQGMANLFRLQERYDDALAFAERALSIVERKSELPAVQRATFVSQVADIHMSAKRYELAEPLLKRALDLAENARDADRTLLSVQVIQYLQSLALVDIARGRYETAQPHIDRALAISTSLLGPDHPMTGVLLGTLALQLLEQDQLDAAERLFEKALSAGETTKRIGALRADNYVGLGLVAFKRKQWPTAYAHLTEAAKITIELEKVATAGGSSRAPATNRAAPRAETFLLQAVTAYRLAEARPADAAMLRDEAFQMAQRAERSTVASALAQMSTRVSARTAPLASLIRKRQDLADEWQRFDNALDSALASAAGQRNAANERANRERLSAISAQLDAIDARVTREFPGFAKLSDPAPLSIGDVQALLRPKEVMIFAAHRLNQSLVWAISREEAAWALVPVGDEQLIREIEALRCGLDETAWRADGARTCAELTGIGWQQGMLLPFDLRRAHRLYRELLEPFAGMTENARLVVATSGPLASVPLQILVTAQPAAGIPGNSADYDGVAWLAKRNAITVLPSVSSLRSLRATARASQATRPFFGVANPALTGPNEQFSELARAARARSTCPTNELIESSITQRKARAALAAPKVRMEGSLAPVDVIRAQTPLPETADEVCAVARSFGATEGDVRLSQHATEAGIKRLSASGELANYRVVHFATHGALAGQVLAGTEPGLILTPPASATPEDDGYLSASEIAALKLDADWVILSACNTAGPAKAGAESLSGLARAFFYAQARAVLVSHWEVDSRAAVSLITGTASALQAEPSVGLAEALRRAMVGLMAKVSAGHSHPRYWAPFVVAGEGGT